MTFHAEKGGEEEQLAPLVVSDEVPPSDVKRIKCENASSDFCPALENENEEVLVTRGHAEFLLDSGKQLYHSWTATDAGLPEFQATLKVLRRLGVAKSDSLAAEAHLWVGHAHAKLKQYYEAASAYHASIQLQEKLEGRYSVQAEEAYKALSKVWRDAGEMDPSNQALLDATRIELHRNVRGGPNAQALTRVFGATMAELTLEAIRKAMALERKALRLFEMGDIAEAVDALEQAALVEDENGDDVQVAYLYRKAALVRMGYLTDQVVVPALCHSSLEEEQQAFCQQMKYAETWLDHSYWDWGSRESTRHYHQALKAYDNQPKTLSGPTVEASEENSALAFPTALFLALLLVGRVLLGGGRGGVSKRDQNATTRPASFTVAAVRWMESIWALALAKWAQIQAHGSRNQDSENEKTNHPLPSSAGRNNILGGSKDDATLDSHLDEGQEILPAVEEHDANHCNNIASSVESLGRLLAGFETEMPELNSRSALLAASSVHLHPHMVPIE